MNSVWRRRTVTAVAAVHHVAACTLAAAVALHVLGDARLPVHMCLAAGGATLAVGLLSAALVKGAARGALLLATGTVLMQASTAVCAFTGQWSAVLAQTLLLAAVGLGTVLFARTYVAGLTQPRPRLVAGLDQAYVLMTMPMLCAPLCAATGHVLALMTLTTVGAAWPALAWAKLAVVARRPASPPVRRRSKGWLARRAERRARLEGR